jgi:hypothetical protein
LDLCQKRNIVTPGQKVHVVCAARMLFIFSVVEHVKSLRSCTQEV